MIKDRSRWLLWMAFGVAWSVALLTTFLVEAGHTVMEDHISYAVGKVIHVTAYALFTLLTAWLPVTGLRQWLCLGLVSLHAMGTEFFQQFVGRTSSWGDVGLNHLGILLGVLLTRRHWKS